MVRIAAIRDLGGFDESLRASEDWDMWRRLCWDHKVAFVHRVLAQYRIHASISRNSWLMRRGELRHLVKLTFDTPATLRHMVVRAWSAFFWRDAANLYAALSTRSGGAVQIAYRRGRGMVTPRARSWSVALKGVRARLPRFGFHRAASP
jgi:hypothetical protein